MFVASWRHNFRKIAIKRLVHPYYSFLSAASDGATTECPIQNRISGQFCGILRKDSIANYGSMWTQFTTSLRGIDVLC